LINPWVSIWFEKLGVVGPGWKTDLGQVLHWQLPVALWRETPSQYPCCVGSAYVADNSLKTGVWRVLVLKTGVWWALKM